MAFLKALVLQLLTAYRVPAVFAGTFLFGDTIVILAFVLGFQLGWNIPLIFLAAMFATLSADTLWYVFGDKIPVFLEKKWPKMFERYEKWFEVVDRSVPFQNPLSMLLYFKFLQGTRIFIVIYLSIRRVRYLHFLLMNFAGTMLWLSSLAGLAYLSVTGTNKLFQQFSVLGPVLTAMFLAFISVRVISKIVSKRVGSTEKK